MVRSLSRAVVAGGVVYPTGTAATPELEALISNPDHWSGGTAPAKAETVAGKTSTPTADDATADYDDMRKPELVAEVDRRNADRSEDDQIVVGGTGKVADLIAALKADDGA